MSWIDVIIVLIFGAYLFEGWRRGFIEQTLELIGFFITIFLALWSYRPLATWLINHIGLQEPLSRPIAFFLLWFILQSLYSFALRWLYPLLPASWRSNQVNKIAGLIPAFIRAFIILAVILTLLISLPVPARLKAEFEGTRIAKKIVGQSAVIENYANRILGNEFKGSLTFLTVPAQNEQIIAPDQKVDLTFKATDVTVDQASEQKMFLLVNQERQAIGLPVLVWDEALAVVARKHSTDMFARGYFAHENPDGQSPFDRMEAAGIKFKTAGENIAYAATVDLAHNGLMRSPGHRANILASDFGHIGIGIIDAGVYGKMFTQDFTN